MSAGFRINTNVPALFAQRQLAITNGSLQRNLERLASGFRINRAGDDAAGLAISERLRIQVNGLKRAALNLQDGISMIQVAEGGVVMISEMLQRIRVLAIQAANDTISSADRVLLQLEVNELISEIDRQATTVQFNQKVLLDGSFDVSKGKPSLVLQVGANSGETFSFGIFSLSAKGLGIRLTTPGSASANTINVDGLFINAVTSAQGETIPFVGIRSDQLETAATINGGIITRPAASSALTLLETAIDRVNSLRAVFGAVQNRMERTLNFIRLSMENQAAAESRVRDLDFAEEIVDFTKNQILQQTGTAALAQANVAPQTVLQLLQ